MTNGAADNLALLQDPASGVDVALMQGGVATSPAADNIVMLASLYYEPLWVFYRGAETGTQLNPLLGKRIAIGLPGSGTRAFVEPLLAGNSMTPPIRRCSRWEPLTGCARSRPGKSMLQSWSAEPRPTRS